MADLVQLLRKAGFEHSESSRKDREIVADAVRTFLQREPMISAPQVDGALVRIQRGLGWQARKAYSRTVNPYFMYKGVSNTTLNKAIDMVAAKDHPQQKCFVVYDHNYIDSDHKMVFTNCILYFTDVNRLLDGIRKGITSVTPAVEYAYHPDVRLVRPRRKP